MRVHVRISLVDESTQGDRADTRSGNSAVPYSSMAIMVWVQVVPHFAGVLTMISPTFGAQVAQRSGCVRTPLYSTFAP